MLERQGRRHAINAILFSTSQHLWRKLQLAAGSEITRDFARHPSDSRGSRRVPATTAKMARSKAVGHAHKPRRQLSPGHWGRTSSATFRIPPTKRQAAADQCQRRGTNGDGLCGIARWYHQVPADIRCAVMPVPYRAADGQEDLAAPRERSTMNTLHRILAYLFRGKPKGPLVIGWSYQNGQRVVFRLPH